MEKVLTLTRQGRILKYPLEVKSVEGPHSQSGLPMLVLETRYRETNPKSDFGKQSRVVSSSVVCFFPIPKTESLLEGLFY